MIPLTLPTQSDAEQPFVTRLRGRPVEGRAEPATSYALANQDGPSFCGPDGLVAIDGVESAELEGDVVLVDPLAGRMERLLRAGSSHNTLLVTERCDQLCIMCSQPPKKTHIDRFALLEQACYLAEPNLLIGITGGEPTLYKEQLLGMIERVLAARGDLSFHVLTNGQHFTADDIERLRNPLFHRVVWGIPLYAAAPDLHDTIVGKHGAFSALEEGFANLLLSGARVELRTVLLTSNADALAVLARYITTRLRFIECWSIMQLEHTGFARRRWHELYVDHQRDFSPIASALDHAKLHHIAARLFNFPRCSVPEPYRYLAAASISDWKRKYAAVCTGCRARDDCCGFFEWHPDAALGALTPL